MQIVVDLSRIRHNVRIIKKRLPCAICAVVKADAYGHGYPIARYIEPIVDCFMTATYAEAEKIALCGVEKPILVASGDIPSFDRMAENIVPTVCDAKTAECMLRQGRRVLSVAVNTGMNRLGADEKELEAIAWVFRSYGVTPWSVYSHIYGGIVSAGEQAKRFAALTDKPIFKRFRHLYSSCALELSGVEMFDMARIGLAMYGYANGLDIAMKARAKIVSVRHVMQGEHVGYGDHTLDRETDIATVRCGYADGLRRTERPLYFTVGGVKCPVVGMPCMDLTMIDVGGAPVRNGEYAYLIAAKSDVEYLASVYDTIIYEVLTGFNGRKEVFYI